MTVVVFVCIGLSDLPFVRKFFLSEHVFLSVSLSFCLSLVILHYALLANCCTYLGDQFRWAFAYLIARHCALYCFVDNNFYFVVARLAR